MTRDLSVSFVPLRVKTERIARPMMKAIKEKEMENPVKAFLQRSAFTGFFNGILQIFL